MVALSEANPEAQGQIPARLDIVKLDGVYYHLDATFDNTLGKAGPIRYTLHPPLNDEKLLRNDEPLLYPAPAALLATGFITGRKSSRSQSLRTWKSGRHTPFGKISR